MPMERMVMAMRMLADVGLTKSYYVIWAIYKRPRPTTIMKCVIWS